MQNLASHLAHTNLLTIARNGALRVCLGAERDTTCIRGCAPTLITQARTLSSSGSKQLLRYPEQKAIVTRIENTGATEVQIFEDDVFLLYSTAGSNNNLPMGGKHVLTALAPSGGSITITTSIRCDCAHPEPSYDSGGGGEVPIGGFLL